MLYSTSSRHTADPQGQKVPVLFHRSTEKIPKTFVDYLYDFEHFTCAFGAVVVYVWDFWHGNHMCDPKLKMSCLIQNSQASSHKVSYTQS